MIRQLIQAFLLWALEKNNPEFAQSKEAMLAEIARLKEDREAQQQYNAELGLELGLLEEKYFEQRTIAEQRGNELEALREQSQVIVAGSKVSQATLDALSAADVLRRL